MMMWLGALGDWVQDCAWHLEESSNRPRACTQSHATEVHASGLLGLILGLEK